MAGAYNQVMSDLVFILVTVGFFALSVGFVRVCDRIVGRDDLPTDPLTPPAPAPAEATVPAGRS